jgi:hypothetical protein
MFLTIIKSPNLHVSMCTVQSSSILFMGQWRALSESNDNLHDINQLLHSYFIIPINICA